MLPKPWTVGVRVWSQGGRDEYGNQVSSWAAPVAVAVHSVAPAVGGTADEPFRPNRALVITGLQVLAPAGTQISARDKVVWPFVVDDAGAVLLSGDEYDVEGEVGDWTSGPWPNPVAGVELRLRRSEG